MKTPLTVMLFLFCITSFLAHTDALSQQEEQNGRYQLKTMKVKSFYADDQGELIRWADDELVKLDTATGRVWRWVSERSKDRKTMSEYWKEMSEGEEPMSEGAR
ncbi:MAG: hypothetical protein HQL30_03195 [Candidatus Omnitrophica bacterium]|nr:hypothetical protein [Candidatus Omnitrophota bacterium]